MRATVGLPNVARLPRGRRPVLAGLVFVTGAFLTYMVFAVPVAAPRLPNGQILFFCPIAATPLPRGEIIRHWPMALLGAAIVLSIATFAVLVARRRARTPALAIAPAPRPSPLRLDRVSRRVVAITAAASATLAIAALAQGYALWIAVGSALLPWVPLVALEAVWKYEHYGLWAIFGVVVLLQIGHMGEHGVQVMQLFEHDGRLAQSHGVFGQLDFETVHFFWDSLIWLSLCLLLTRFGRGNRWLWVAFAAASIHEVEHLYLYWLYLAHPALYMHGGFEGIMGNGGLVGSPLARPYLHFAYNFLVVVPMVLAFLDESRRVTDRATFSAPGARSVSVPV
jgi:hypothetical protein